MQIRLEYASVFIVKFLVFNLNNYFDNLKTW